MSEVDVKRLKRYCLTIRENAEDINHLLSRYSDEELIKDRYLLKALKYALIETAEAMANTLQHLLARLKGEAASSYLEVAEKAKGSSLINPALLERLTFFFKFRNMLIHRYWEIDDRRLFEETRKGQGDFEAFIKAIDQKLRDLGEEN